MALFTEHLVRAHGFTGFKYTTTLQTGVAYSTSQSRQQWGELARPSQATAVELPANLGGLGSTHPQSQSRQHVQPENTDSCSKSVTARQVVPSSLKVPQDTCSELSPLGHWDLLRTLLRTLPKGHPPPHPTGGDSPAPRSARA